MTAPVIDTTTSLVDVEAIPWADFGGGIEVKMLRVGGETGTYTVITRFAPGVQLPKHRHFGSVHAYTIEGRWHYLEYPWVAETGSFIFEPPGSVHTLKVPDDNPGPTVVLFTIDKGMVFLGDDDELAFVEDGPGLAAHYAAQLATQGDAYPSGILP
jgi:quercetin dioxygenase-like cupin family protein